MKNVALLWWVTYKHYIGSVVLPPGHDKVKDIIYWRNATFARLLIYMAPIGLVALLPCLYMSFQMRMVVVGMADLAAFLLLLFIMIYRGLSIYSRKIVFLFIFYSLSIVLMSYLATSGVGMLYLLALTVITGVIYSPRTAYYAALANTLICIAFGALCFFKLLSPVNNNYTVGGWIAVSSNLVLLSFICTKCLVLLLNGLEANMKAKSAAETEMAQLTNRLLLATSSAGMGIWEWDIRLDDLSWDEGMLKLYDITGLKLRSVYQVWLATVHPEDKYRVNREIQLAISGEKEYDTEFRIVWGDMTTHYVRATGMVERDDAGTALRMIGANWDVTIRKQEIHRLKVSEANLKAVINNTVANIYSLDTDFRYIYFNDVLKTNVRQNYGVEIAVGDRIFDFLEQSAPGEALEWRQIYTRALTGESLEFEKEFNVGGYTSTISFSINPILENEEVIGLTCFGIDVTEIKKARQELESLNEVLEAKVAERTAELANANKELEAFSYSVSHDLRAPVRALIGFAQIIKSDHEESLNEDVKDMFGYMYKSAKRMDSIIKDLLVLAKYGKERLVMTEVDLSELFRDIWDSLVVTTPHHATLHLQPMPVVYADRSMLQQVIVNMLSNAIKYSSKKDHPVITVGYSNTSESFTIYVKDNGAGFDMKHYDRLFGAFQRLHGETEFEGTGVGLMLTKKIIDRHGGTVWADGKVGDGATFYFSLPSAA